MKITHISQEESCSEMVDSIMQLCEAYGLDLSSSEARSIEDDVVTILSNNQPELAVQPLVDCLHLEQSDIRAALGLGLPPVTAELKMEVTPVIKQSRTITEEFEVCPHCNEEIREKSTFGRKVGNTWYTFHRGACADKAPIDSFTEDDAKAAFENTFFGRQTLQAQAQTKRNVPTNLQQIFKCPLLRAGDILHVGKYKNVAIKVMGFGMDENNQPTVVSEDGTESKVFGFRIAKLLPPGKGNV